MYPSISDNESKKHSHSLHFAVDVASLSVDLLTLANLDGFGCAPNGLDPTTTRSPVSCEITQYVHADALALLYSGC